VSLEDFIGGYSQGSNFGVLMYNIYFKGWVEFHKYLAYVIDVLRLELERK